MSDRESAKSDALDAATRRRFELRSAISGVEIAAAAPSAGENWRENLLAELDGLARALDTHVEEVEGEDGLFVELTANSPRLISKIKRLQDEHPVLQQQVTELIAATPAIDDAERLRAMVLDALVAIAKHRQRGADLVYEGYTVDIGDSS